MYLSLQVNCIEMSTNSGTVRKQVRDTLKQLQKDRRVVRGVLGDLALPDHCLHLVMALPNITADLLKQRLEPSFVQVATSFLCGGRGMGGGEGGRVTDIRTLTLTLPSLDHYFVCDGSPEGRPGDF